jgi:hypothetical protein
MDAITQQQLRELDSAALAARMDAFFVEDYAERYGGLGRLWPDAVAVPVLATAKLQALEEAQRKRALTMLFRARFQVSLCAQQGGFANRHVHDVEAPGRWQSARRQIANAATRQATILAARVAFECLMEFIHLVMTGNLIKVNKKGSKFAPFREWICSAGNPFGWLVFYLLVTRRFDKLHRTPEVHGTSYIATEALCCGEWPSADSELDVLNVMMGIWPLLVLTLDGGRPLGGQYAVADEAIFQHFLHWPDLNLDEFWKQHASD